jgi:hypothetical protein
MPTDERDHVPDTTVDALDFRMFNVFSLHEDCNVFGFFFAENLNVEWFDDLYPETNDDVHAATNMTEYVCDILQFHSVIQLTLFFFQIQRRTVR